MAERTLPANFVLTMLYPRTRARYDVLSERCQASRRKIDAVMNELALAGRLKASEWRDMVIRTSLLPLSPLNLFESFEVADCYGVIVFQRGVYFSQHSAQEVSRRIRAFRLQYGSEERV